MISISAFHVNAPTVAPPWRHRHAALASPSLTSTAEPLLLQSKSRTAPSKVVDTFDDYAATFESHLVGSLKYCAPYDVAKAASARVANHRGGARYASALDAGCGTGLAGPPLRRLVAGPLVGVDLSPKMAELAAELVVDAGPAPMVENRMRRSDEAARTALGAKALDRLYDGVFTADLLHLSDATFLDGFGHEVQTIPSGFDLIVSADVLCYFGAMDAVLASFSERLLAGGDVIFTTETMSGGDYNWVELSSGRFAQSPEYVARCAADAGLAKVSQVAFTPRMESGEEVLGTLHTFTKQ